MDARSIYLRNYISDWKKDYYMRTLLDLLRDGAIVTLIPTEGRNSWLNR